MVAVHPDLIDRRPRPATGTFVIPVTCLIQCQREDLCNFHGDPKHDSLWRYESNPCHADGPFKEGTNYKEEVALAKFLPYLMAGRFWHFPIQLVKKRAPYGVLLYENPHDPNLGNMFLSVQRLYTEEKGGTRVRWNLEIDNRVPALLGRQAFGFPLPIVVAKWSFVALLTLNMRFSLKPMMESGRFKKIQQDWDDKVAPGLKKGE